MEKRSGIKNLKDKGGTRSGYERRHYTAIIHIPERRSGRDRRSAVDRRKNPVEGHAHSTERRADLSCRQKQPNNEPDSTQKD
jgi:hypothetical protein